MKLPKFKYHPNPLATQSIKKSAVQCICCGKTRDYIYSGPVYAEKELHDKLCPWCIADGSVHEKYNAEFIDPLAIGNHGLWDNVPEMMRKEIAFCTPGFVSWQDGLWWTHCGAGAEFLGFAGREEAIMLGSDFLQALRSSVNIKDEKQWQNYLDALDKDNGPTAYIFRCTKCHKYGGYSDSH
jgi:uncharacterized protein CbrC (UPF0167 family)